MSQTLESRLSALEQAASRDNAEDFWSKVLRLRDKPDAVWMREFADLLPPDKQQVAEAEHEPEG